MDSQGRVEARFTPEGTIEVRPSSLLPAEAREEIARLAPRGVVPERRFWALCDRLGDHGVSVVVPPEGRAWLAAHERKFTVLADRLDSGGLGLLYRGGDKRVEGVVRAAAPKVWLKNPMRLRSVAEDLAAAGARLKFTPAGEEALERIRRSRKVWIRESGADVEVAHHPSLSPRIRGEVERWTTDEALDDALALPLLEDALREAGAWLEVDEGARRLCRVQGMSRVLVAPSARFPHTAQVLPALAEMPPKARGPTSGFVDDWGLLASARAAANLEATLRESGVECRVSPDVEALAREEDAIAEGASPDILAEPLLGHQATGASFLAVRGRALLGDEMGLGKTVQAIAGVLLLRKRSPGLRALVVVPASLRGQWAEEIARFAGEEAVVVRGPPKKRRELWETDSRWKVVNYEILLKDDARPAAEGAVLVLDECQRIKNWQAKTTRAIGRLAPRHVFGLSGTPLENDLGELFTVMRAIEPRALGWSPGPFRRRHLVLDRFGAVVGTKGLDEVRRRLSGVFLRRRKEEVLEDLPPLTERVHRVPLPAAQMAVYRRRAEAAVDAWRGRAEGEGLETVLERLLRMREACDDPALLGEEGPSGKWAELSRLLEALGDRRHKVLVFTEWSRMGEILCGRLADSGRRHAWFHGGLGEAEREAAVASFLGDEEVQVMVATDAAAHGLNLQGAGLVVNYDLPYNPAKVAQRVARAHRIGRADPVLALHLVAENTVEERVLRILRRKRELFANVVGDEAAGTFAPGLGTEETLEILLGE